MIILKNHAIGNGVLKVKNYEVLPKKLFKLSKISKKFSQHIEI